MKWVEPIKNKLIIDQTSDYWEKQSRTNSWEIWSGYNFESFCFKHVSEIQKALGISGLVVSAYPWRCVDKSDVGAQIDLVLDRSDGCTTLCEIKYSENEFAINKSYAKNLQNKVNRFKEETGTKKHIFLAMITVAGVKKNEYSAEITSNQVVLDDFFKE